jgi:hypothetical protein
VRAADAISVDGPDKALVDELRRILSMDGNLMADASIHLPTRGFSTHVSFGTITESVPPGAVITVGVKPIK